MRLLTLCLVLVIISSALLLAGCGGGSDGSGSQATSITGRVCDAGSRLPLLGVKVVIPSVTQTTTNADGVFTFSRGASSLVLAGTGYLTQTVPVPSANGGVDLGNLYLVPAPVAGYGNITGTIVEAGLPVQGAIVTCSGRTSYTDSQGQYTLYNVASGSHQLSARNPSEGTGATVGVTVTSLTTVTVNLQLTITPPLPPLT